MLRFATVKEGSSMCCAITLICAESVLVMAGLGVQLRTLHYGNRERFVFLDKRRIADVIVNEAIVRQSDVITYLAFVIQGEDKLAIAFEASAL